MQSLLYINGLGPEHLVERPFEIEALEEFEAAGISTYHAAINWSNLAFLSDCVNRLASKVEDMSETGPVTIAGFSAGGSLAVHTLHSLAGNPNVSAYSIAGRLRVGEYSWWNPRELSNAAHMGIVALGGEQYPVFRASVYRLDNHVAPELSDQEKSRLAIIKPKRDFVVPRKLMEIDGVESITVPAYSHNGAAVKGLRYLLNHMRAAEPSQG